MGPCSERVPKVSEGCVLQCELQCVLRFIIMAEGGVTPAMHCNTHSCTLQHTATHCNALHRTANILQHTANTLQHAATRCITLLPGYRGRGQTMGALCVSSSWQRGSRTTLRPVSDEKRLRVSGAGYLRAYSRPFANAA